MLSTLWVGALWAIGYLVAPILFSRLPDRALAGQIAGWMFSAVGMLGMVCASALILILLLKFTHAAAASARVLDWRSRS